MVCAQSLARGVGTTVAIRELFRALPVRHQAAHQIVWLRVLSITSSPQELKRNLKREYSKLLSLLNG